MKKLLRVLFILALVFTVVSCQNNANLETVLNDIQIEFSNTDNISSVTTHLSLPQTSDKNKNAAISWVSDHPLIIDDFGTVNRPGVNTDVKLTVTVTLGGKSESKDFYVTVLGLYNDVTVEFRVLDEVYRSFTVKAGQFITAFPDPSVPGYTFAGWFISPEMTKAFSFTSPVQSSLVVEASMTEIEMGSYTVEVYYQNIDDELYTLESTENLQDVVGSTYAYPETPEGFTPNMELTSPVAQITKTNQTFKLYYDRNSYVVTFMSDGISVGTQNLKYGELVTPPTTELEKDDHILEGWAYNSAGTALFDTNILISESLTLYAVWTYDSLYTGYYAPISGVTDTYLKSSLRALISQMNLRTYGEARYILDDSDRDPNNAGKVILVYSRNSVSGTWDNGYTWSREHVWPQSMLGASAENSTKNIASDLQNLKPIYQPINEVRSNKPFSAGSGTHGVASDGGYYPGDQDRGDIARILFYMHVRWNLSISRSTVGELSLLLQWHLEDPVDDFERNRNEVISNSQGNRNPFIDHPEFAERIWGPITVSTSSSEQMSLTMNEPVQKVIVTISYDVNFNDLKRNSYQF